MPGDTSFEQLVSHVRRAMFPVNLVFHVSNHAVSHIPMFPMNHIPFPCFHVSMFPSWHLPVFFVLLSVLSRAHNVSGASRCTVSLSTETINGHSTRDRSLREGSNLDAVLAGKSMHTDDRRQGPYIYTLRLSVSKPSIILTCGCPRQPFVIPTVDALFFFWS